MRNSAWSVAILETIFREAGSTLVLRAPWDWARLHVELRVHHGSASMG